MAKEIPAELQTFKDKVDGKTGNMTTTVTSISSKISELSNVMNSTKSSVSEAYQSSTSVNQAVTKLSNTVTLMDGLKGNIESTISDAVGKADSLLSKIKELEDLITKIAAEQQKLNTENSKEEPNSSLVSSYRSNISKYETDFDTKKDEALSDLAALKALDKELEEANAAQGSGNALNNYTQYINNLKFGTFSFESYTAKNGEKIDYYLYIPDYGGQTVNGIPIHIYLHGSGNTGTKIGLAYELENKNITPSCICICPQSYDNKNFYKGSFQEAIIELSYNIADQYNGDKNKISVSGHSMGAIAGSKLVGNNSGVFSAFVPISGYCYGNHGEGLTDTTVWAFHGAKDSTVNYSTQKGLISNLSKNGGNAYLYTYDREGHGWVQNYTFERTFTDPETGEETTVLDWCARHTSSVDHNKA